MRVDFPEPEIPVTTVSAPTGISSVTFLSVLPEAPMSFSHSEFAAENFLAFVPSSTVFARDR